MVPRLSKRRAAESDTHRTSCAKSTKRLSGMVISRRPEPAVRGADARLRRRRDPAAVSLLRNLLSSSTQPGASHLPSGVNSLATSTQRRFHPSHENQVRLIRRKDS